MHRIKLFFLKLINLIVFLEGVFFYIFKVRIKSYPAPPPRVVDIGFFDKSLLANVSDQYKHLFDQSNLGTEDDYIRFKPDRINLALYEEIVLVRKSFMGPMKNRAKFFNEIKCLHKLGLSGNVPRIYFVDYRQLVVYIEYMHGDCLQRIIGSKNGYPESIRSIALECCRAALRRIHEKNVVVVDVQAQNIIYNPEKQDACFIDFADSICANFVPRGYLNFLLKRDESQMSERVLSKL